MNKLALALSIFVIVATGGCALGPGVTGIDPNDPAGSASVGTGSVTSNSVISEEAKAAGMGVSP